MRSRPTRLLLAVAAAIALLLAGLQVVLPRQAEGDVEERLTRGGGSAEVSIRSRPAVRLLLGGDGDRIEVRAREIEIDPSAEERPLEALDGFGEVDVLIEDAQTGPVDTRLIEIARDGDEPYRLRVEATIVPRELAAFAGSQLGPLGGLFGGMAADALPGADLPLPLEVDAEVESDDGRPRVVEGGGSVAGIPLGPVADFLIRAIANRI